MPLRAGLAPTPIAVLNANRLLMTVCETPMLDSPPPFEQVLPCVASPPNVVLTTYTGSGSAAPAGWYWLSVRTDAPPTSGPLASQRLPKNRLLTILKRPPRTKIAPPPSGSRPVASPLTNVRFCTVSCG